MCSSLCFRLSGWRSSPTRTRSLRAPYIGVLPNGFSARVLSFITFTQNSAGFSLCAFVPLLSSLLCSSLLISESTSSRLCLSLVVHDSNNCVTSRYFKLGQNINTLYLYYTYILEKCLEIIKISHKNKFLQISNLITNFKILQYFLKLKQCPHYTSIFFCKLYK